MSDPVISRKPGEVYAEWVAPPDSFDAADPSLWTLTWFRYVHPFLSVPTPEHEARAHFALQGRELPSLPT